MSSSQSAGRAVHVRVLSAFFSIALWGAILRFCQAAKDLLVARDFGTGSQLDGFLTAFIVPSFLTYALAAPIGDAFLPVFIAATKRDRSAAQRLLGSTLVASAAGFALLVGTAAILAAPLVKLVGSGLEPATLALARRCFLLMVPTVLFAGLAAPFTAVLNSAERYRTTVLTPLATPLLTLVFLLTLRRTLGAYALVLGVVLGAIAELSILAIGARRLGWSIRPRWSGRDEEVRRVAGQYAPLVAGSLLLTGTTIIDQSMAAMLGPRNVSALNYATKVVGALIGLANLAIGTPIMTTVPRLIAGGDWGLVRRSFRLYASWLFAATIPATALLVWLSPEIVSLLFERGSFTSADTALVSAVERCYLLQIPFHLLGVLAVRFLMGMSYNRVLLYISGVQVVVNVVANLVLMHFFGLAGIALSTTLVFAVAMLLAFIALNRLLRRRTA